jgi:hypothetical protein
MHRTTNATSMTTTTTTTTTTYGVDCVIGNSSIVANVTGTHSGERVDGWMDGWSVTCHNSQETWTNEREGHCTRVTQDTQKSQAKRSITADDQRSHLLVMLMLMVMVMLMLMLMVDERSRMQWHGIDGELSQES